MLFPVVIVEISLSLRLSERAIVDCPRLASGKCIYLIKHMRVFPFPLCRTHTTHVRTRGSVCDHARRRMSTRVHVRCVSAALSAKACVPIGVVSQEICNLISSLVIVSTTLSNVENGGITSLSKTNCTHWRRRKIAK